MIRSIAFALLATVTLVACDKKVTVPSTAPSPGPSVTASPTATPTVAPAAVRYTAIGASDAVGYGASVPCANPPAVAVPTCPGGTGYVPDIANLLTQHGSAVTLDDLGISGAVIGPDILATVNQYGALGSADACAARSSGDAYPTDFVTAEAPQLTSGETLVTIFAGGNDTNGIANAAACMAAANPPATTAQVQSFVNGEIAAFGGDLQTLIARVRSTSPAAKIYVANLPNFSLIPVGLAQSTSAQELLAAVSVGIDESAIDPQAANGVPVVDLLCNPQSYAPSNFSSDGFHPNDAGYGAFAAAFFTQIVATTPVAPNPSCSYASANATLGHVPRAPLPDFSRGKHR